MGSPFAKALPPPDALRRVHFIAVGGTGMGSLAGLLKARGIEVTGSDKALYPPMSDALARWQIPIVEGFSPDNLTGSPFGSKRAPDLIVIGNAVRPDNPEAQAAIDSGIAYRSFSDALFELAMADKHRIVVTGTHGKTTTTSLVAHLLAATGRDPSLLVGGISLDFDGSFREGKGDHFVVEGDEYDTVFFDKTPKFLHYHPKSLILTSVEFDHADIYRDLDHVKSAFRDLIAAMPADGVIAADVRHEGVRDVIAQAPCDVIRYAVDDGESQIDGADWLAEALTSDPAGTRFELRVRDRKSRSAQLPLHGAFNVANALAALAVLDYLGVGLGESLPALTKFRGVKRRQEIRGEEAGVVVVDDFAHHPTAVKASLSALRARFPQSRLIAVFEARTNTSRRAIFQDAYAQAFDTADRVLIRKLPEEPIYSATGAPSDLFSAEDLVAALHDRGVDAECFADIDAFARDEAQRLEPGDVVLVMSNGDFENVWEKLLAALRRE